jgi:hypothetical protein
VDHRSGGHLFAVVAAGEGVDQVDRDAAPFAVLPVAVFHRVHHDATDRDLLGAAGARRDPDADVAHQ